MEKTVTLGQNDVFTPKINVSIKNTIEKGN